MSIFAHSRGVLDQNWVRFGRVLLNDPYFVFCLRMKSNYLNEVIASLKEKEKCSIWVLCQFLLQNFLQKIIIKGCQQDLKVECIVTNLFKLPSV